MDNIYLNDLDADQRDALYEELMDYFGGSMASCFYTDEHGDDYLEIMEMIHDQQAYDNILSLYTG